MSAEFEARKKLGELYDEHLSDGDGVYENTADIDGITFYLTIRKESTPQQYLDMQISNSVFDYRYSYTGDPEKPFVLSNLIPKGPIHSDNR